MSSPHHVVLVSVGVFQEYITHNIQQLLKLGYTVHVITEACFLKKLEPFPVKAIDESELGCNFNEHSRLDRDFRSGFWHSASKRLFLLYHYLQKHNLESVIHLENDVLLYARLPEIDPTKIYLTMDAPDRCIPGILYIPNHQSLHPLIEEYDYTANDMTNMARFYHRHRALCQTFPIIPPSSHNTTPSCYSENFKSFNGIFDAAAIGQYLGGVDPRNLPGDTRGFVNETCVVKYNAYTFSWFRKNDVVIPYIVFEGKHIPIYCLHIHSKRLDDFTTKPSSPMNFITGERVQFACDHFVGTRDDLCFNPNVANHASKWIILGEQYTDVDNGPIIFSYLSSSIWTHQEPLIQTLLHMKNPFSLVFHNGDGSLSSASLFEALPLLHHIHTQNLQISHPRMRPIGIGLANSQWAHGNTAVFEEIYQQPIPKTKQVYFNFNKATNSGVRQECYTKLASRLSWVPNMGYREYIQELKSHMFCICPEGNGIDTHRFWECLYMNTVPIVKRNYLVECLSQIFPVLILEDWTDLDLYQLPQLYHTYSFEFVHLDLDNVMSQIRAPFAHHQPRSSSTTQSSTTPDTGALSYVPPSPPVLYSQGNPFLTY